MEFKVGDLVCPIIDDSKYLNQYEECKVISIDDCSICIENHFGDIAYYQADELELLKSPG